MEVSCFEYESLSQVEKLRKKGIPFILKNAINDWPAVAKWDFGYLKSVLGSTTVQVEVGELFECTSTKNGSIDWNNTDWKNISFEEFVDSIVNQQAEPRYYLTEWSPFRENRALLKDVNYKSSTFFSRLFSAPIRLYIGPAGAYTPIHFDYAPNFTAQIVGKKLWTVYSPDKKKYLYHYPSNGNLAHFSRANTREKTADYSRFPLLENLDCLQITLSAGDLIYIPPRWSHSVESLEPGITVHMFFKDWKQYVLQLLMKPLNIFAGKKPASDVTLHY